MKFYKKIELFLFSFFQGLTNVAEKIGIKVTALINSVLIVQLLAQALQIYYLYKAKQTAVEIFLFAFPTLLIALYLYKLVKRFKPKLIILDPARIIVTFYVPVVIFSFAWKSFVGFIFNIPPTDTSRLYVKAEIAYSIAAIAFLSFIYLLSCSNKVKKDIKKLNDA